LLDKIPGVVPAASALGLSFSVFLYIPVVEGSSFVRSYPGLTLTFQHNIPLIEPIVIIAISIGLIFIAYWFWTTKWENIIKTAFQ
jgi:hypothetical protein